MDNFWAGFEKRAGGILKGLANLTGVGQMSRGVQGLKKLHADKLIKPGEGWAGAMKPAVAAGGKQTERRLAQGMGNLASGAKRLGATAAIGTGAAYAGSKLLGGGSQAQQQMQQYPGYN